MVLRHVWYCQISRFLTRDDGCRAAGQHPNLGCLVVGVVSPGVACAANKGSAWNIARVGSVAAGCASM